MEKIFLLNFLFGILFALPAEDGSNLNPAYLYNTPSINVKTDISEHRFYSNNLDKDAYIVEQYHNDDGNGNYEYYFSTSNDIKRYEKGTFIKDKDHVNGTMRVEGFYSYVNKGINYTTTYVADENGYRPKFTQNPIYTQEYRH